MLGKLVVVGKKPGAVVHVFAQLGVLVVACLVPLLVLVHLQHGLQVLVAAWAILVLVLRRAVAQQNGL